MRTFAILTASALVLGACSSAPDETALTEEDGPAIEEGRVLGGSTDVRLRRMVALSSPIAIATRAGDEDAYYVAEREGRVKRVVGSRVTGTVLNITDRTTTDGERGLLGITFSPNGARLYVDHTDNNGDTNVARYRMNGNRAVADSRVRILKVAQPYENHNGGDIHFGPDGYLYVALGDGGSGGDPHGNGQSIDTLLGKILRIDPTDTGYRNPPDNPFVGRDGRNEILHYGLRNPWRFTFDPQTDMMWIGDVGQNLYEEVDRIPSSTTGANFGWARMEGRHSFEGRSEPSNHHRPIHEYSHAGGRCAITGGVVMHDPRLPALDGRYLFSDLCDGTIRYLRRTSDGWRSGSLGVAASSVVSFGVLTNGRVFVLSLAGNVYRIDPA